MFVNEKYFCISKKHISKIIMAVNQKKYLNLLLFFIKECNNKYLGIVKLNKLFYYLDFIFYRDNKKSVTGDIYISRGYGPVPSQIDNIISKAKTKKMISVDEQISKDRKRVVFKALKDYDLSCLNDKEKVLLKKIVKQFKGYSTDEIVDQTHLEAPWFYANLYDKIDYRYSNDIDFFQCQK